MYQVTLMSFRPHLTKARASGGRSAARRRRGAALVEGALVLGTLLTLVLGMFDLSAAVHRHNLLSEAARRGAREAIVHGQQAAPARDVWGPSEYSVTADASSAIAETVRPLLVGMQPEDVTITLQWPDGSNKAPNRVRCRITTVYRPVTPFAIGAEISLSATSTMPVAN